MKFYSQLSQDKLLFERFFLASGTVYLLISGLMMARNLVTLYFLNNQWAGAVFALSRSQFRSAN